ncbi:MAG TPA: S8 family serine peptidase, partial [Mycobacteriales bacterium]|nr:S8 family serine peptidase [Mycobacteriales bacterium]
MTRRSVLLLLLATGLGLGAAAGAPSSASPRPTGWVEVDFAGPLGAGQRAALEAAGASAVQPAHGSTYLAFAPGAGLRVPGATRVRALTPADKGWSSFASLAGLQPAIVLAHASMPLEREFGRLGGQVRAAFPMSAGGEVVAVTGRIDVRRLSTLAGRRDVLHVAPVSWQLKPEDEASVQIMAGGMNSSMEPLPGYRAFLQRHGVTGKGVKVTVVDDGIDSGHPELSGRVTLVARNPEPPQGHGTHVAGIIGGRGVQLAPGIEAKDGAGRLYGVGVAPDVTFIDINEITLVNTLFFDFPPDDGFGTLTRAALQLG